MCWEMNCGSSFGKHHMHEFHSRGLYYDSLRLCSLLKTSVKCLFFLPFFCAKDCIYSVIVQSFKRSLQRLNISFEKLSLPSFKSTIYSNLAFNLSVIFLLKYMDHPSESSVLSNSNPRPNSLKSSHWQLYPKFP